LEGAATKPGTGNPGLHEDRVRQKKASGDAIKVIFAVRGGIKLLQSHSGAPGNTRTEASSSLIRGGKHDIISSPSTREKKRERLEPGFWGPGVGGGSQPRTRWGNVKLQGKPGRTQ